jgi:hypothetical protein
MKRITLLLAVTIMLCIVNTSCKKTVTVTKTVVDSVLIRSVDTTFLMNAKNWSCYSYLTLNLVDSGTTTYSTTSDGIKFMGQAYRYGARAQIKSEVGFVNKVVYFKWKAYGAGLFAVYVPEIKYDALSNDGTPAIQGVDLGAFSVNGTSGGSIVIQENTWYYTRLVPNAGLDTYQVITCSGNYSNMGGAVIANTTIPIYTKSGYIALRMGDCYGSTSAYGILSECKIASN